MPEPCVCARVFYFESVNQPGSISPRDISIPCPCADIPVRSIAGPCSRRYQRGIPWKARPYLPWCLCVRRSRHGTHPSRSAGVPRQRSPGSSKGNQREPMQQLGNRHDRCLQTLAAVTPRAHSRSMNTKQHSSSLDQRATCGIKKIPVSSIWVPAASNSHARWAEVSGYYLLRGNGTPWVKASTH